MIHSQSIVRSPRADQSQTIVAIHEPARKEHDGVSMRSDGSVGTNEGHCVSIPGIRETIWEQPRMENAGILSLVFVSVLQKPLFLLRRLSRSVKLFSASLGHRE
jgi:hypothetical protein